MGKLFRSLNVLLIVILLLVACQPQLKIPDDQNTGHTSTNTHSQSNTDTDNQNLSGPTSFDGTYIGEIQRGYDIEFTVKDSQVVEVIANVLEQCSDSTTTNVTTVYFEGPFDVNEDGSVFIEGIDEITGGDYKFSAILHEDGTASGTLLQEYVITGVVCTTGELEWSTSKE